MLYRSALALLTLVLAWGSLHAEEREEQVCFELRLLSVPETTFERLKETFGLSEKKTMLASDKALHALLEAVQGDPNSNILAAPRVCLLLGQPATVQIGEQHPIHTGARVAIRNGKVAIEPELTVVETGLKVVLDARAPGGQGTPAASVDLDLQVVSSKLGKVEQVPIRVEKQTQKIQKAEVLRNTVERKVNVPFDRTVVLTGWWEEVKGQKEPQRIIVCVTARPVK